MKEKEKAVQRIREFNRFYLPELGLLDNRYLGSDYSPAEARALFEAYENDGCNAAYIARTMNIDKSYLSRIIRAYEKNGYLIRTVSQQDSRSFDIHLTKKGVNLAEELIKKSDCQIENIIEALSKEEYVSLAEALDTVSDILKKCKDTKE